VSAARVTATVVTAANGAATPVKTQQPKQTKANKLTALQPRRQQRPRTKTALHHALTLNVHSKPPLQQPTHLSKHLPKLLSWQHLWWLKL
jgi:hypothetical protein